MNLRDLKYLLAVSEHRNFSKAAQHCATSQPTLSNQIKKLEDYLEVEIFERGTHYVRVTPVGEQIIDIAKTVIDNSNLIVQIARSAIQSSQSKLIMGSFPSLSSHVPLEYIFRLKQHFEKLKVQLHEDDVDALATSLERREIDMALLPYPTEGSSLEGVKLFDDPLYVAVPDDHPLANLKSIEVSDLSDQHLLFLVDDQSHYLQILNEVDASFSDSHPEQNEDFKAISFESLRVMVKHGLGIAIIPSVAIQPEDSDLRYIPFSTPEVKRSIGLYWHKQHMNNELLKDLGRLLAYKPIQ